jgi:hypothetical protein
MDETLRSLEREWQATGSTEVYFQLLRYQYRIAPTLENARALFDACIEQRLPIDLGDDYIHLLMSDEVQRRHLQQRIGHYSPSPLRIQGRDLRTPIPVYDPLFKTIQPQIDKAEENTLEIVRSQSTDYDLAKIDFDPVIALDQMAGNFREASIQALAMEKLQVQLAEFVRIKKAAIYEIQEDRLLLRSEHHRYMVLIDQLGDPLEAGKAWYQEKIKAYKADHPKHIVLLPDTPIIENEGSFQDLSDEGLYHPDCFFPLYGILANQGYPTSEGLNYFDENFIIQNSYWGSYKDWEDELEEEAKEAFCNENGISEEEFEEKSEQGYGSEAFYDFHKYFRDEYIEKEKKRLVKELREEQFEQLIEEIEGYSEETTIIKYFLNTDYPDFDFDDSQKDWKDNVWIGESSYILDSPDEYYPNHVKGQELFKRPPVLNDEPRRYRSHSEKPKHPWRSVCDRTYILKVDTRAIGWRAAFGLPPE